MKFGQLILLASWSLIAMSCVSTNNNPAGPPVSDAESKRVQAFEAANALFDSEDFEAASKAYDAMLVEHPVSTLDGLVLFNSGLSHQMAGRCDVAISRLRKLVRFVQNRSSEPLLYRAKLKLSDAYSCVGDNNKSMLLLAELFKERQKLPAIIGQAEVPAKLAAGYSRLGNRKMAQRFFAIADQGLKTLEVINSKKREFGTIMSKTLFTMGDIHKIKFSSDEYAEYFNTLKVLQSYLLRAASYGDKVWSSRAADALVDAYANVWVLVDDLQPKAGGSAVISQRQLKVEKSKLAQMALTNLLQLKRHKIPGAPSKEIQTMLLGLDKEERKLRNYLVAEAPGVDLTEEGRRLLAPKREGRVKSKPTILEKRAKEK